MTTAKETFTITTTVTVNGGGAAGGGLVSSLLAGGVVVAGGAFALYSSVKLYNAQQEQVRLFAQVDKENRQRLHQQQQKQQDDQGQAEPEPSSSGAGSRKGGAGRGFSGLIKDFQKNQSQWELVATHAEAATGKKARGGTSIQQVYRNKETGQTIVRQTRYNKKGKKIDEHFRPYAK